MPQHAVATRLTSEERLLDRELDPLEERGGGLPAIDPLDDTRERTTEPGVATDRERATEPVEEARHAIGARPRVRLVRRAFESVRAGR